MSKFDFIAEELARREETSQLRYLRTSEPLDGPLIRIDGRQCLTFCANDYLGLSGHPLLKERATAFVERYGAGATASRLVCGNLPCFRQVEEKLALLKGTEAALVLNSGFQANVSLIPALADKNALILSDVLNHNSIIQGCLLSRARIMTFRHNDLDHLEELLKENREKGYSRILIVTESVFSMDGDRVDVDRLVTLSKAYDALLMVDEAHATGVLGEKGMGLTCGKKVDIIMGTFSKGFGAFGAYIACSRLMRNYMINCCSGFIYATGLPPAVMGAVDAALDLIPDMDRERAELQAKARRLRAALQAMGWSTGFSSTQIIPVLVGKEDDALALSRFLEDRGILASAIRPPTVPDGESRIRLTLSVRHTDAHLDLLIDAFRAWRGIHG